MSSSVDIEKYIIDYVRYSHREPLIFTDKDGILIWVNKSAADLGASIGMDCKELLGEEFDIKKVCAGKKSEFEIVVKNPKFAKNIPFESVVLVKPIFKNNKFAGALLDWNYISSSQLKKNKLLLESINFSPVSIIITDEQFQIVYMNSICKLYFSQLNLSPKNLDEIIKALGYPSEFIENMHKNLDDAGFYSFRSNSARIDGRYFEHSFFKIFDENKKHIGYLIWSNDITDHLKISERKRQLLKHEFLERFSSQIFHKLNNQFLIVMADAGLIRRKLPPDCRIKVLNHIIELEDHLLEVSETVQLLSLFVRSPKQKYENIDIIEFLESRVTKLMESLPDSVELSIELPDSSVMINGYPSLLDKIFEAILDNAVRAVFDNGGRIVVSGESIQPDGIFLMNYPELSDVPYFKITIADTGIGIEKEKMSKIFEPFFSDWAKKSRGLGLPVAMSAIRHHGGTIDIQSTVGVGTTVSLFFPIRTVEKQVKKVLSAMGEGNVILIIDDDDYVRNALAQMLESLGYIPISASSGREGIELFSKTKPDVVLLDMVIPDIKGEKVFKKLKEIEPDCPIVVSTAYAQIESVEELIENGVEYILQKPFTINQLSEILGKIFKVGN